jgi:ABC-type glycerol-3-phosphate transport system substrate-binding protein
MNNKHGIGTLVLLLLTSFSADAAKVYSWVDGNGITHYSDAPPPGKNAKEVDLRVAPLIGSGSPRSVQVENFNSLTGADAKKEKEAAKLAIELLSPEQGSTLRDNTGNIVFQGTISPKPPTQYDVRLTLDGKAAPIVSNSLSIRVENVDRGAHEAQLELLAKDGTILAKSSAVTFYLHRASVTPAPKPTPKAD